VVRSKNHDSTYYAIYSSPLLLLPRWERTSSSYGIRFKQEMCCLNYDIFMFLNTQIHNTKGKRISRTYERTCLVIKPSEHVWRIQIILRKTLRTKWYFGLCKTLKGTGKFAPVHAMKTYRGNGGTAPLIHILVTKWGEWSTSDPERFSPRTEPCYPLNRRLGGPQRRSAHSGEQKLYCPHWDSNPRPSIP
jgi:hypothetical protein